MAIVLRVPSSYDLETISQFCPGSPSQGSCYQLARTHGGGLPMSSSRAEPQRRLLRPPSRNRVVLSRPSGDNDGGRRVEGLFFTFDLFCV
jgi:hypothetical protein